MTSKRIQELAALSASGSLEGSDAVEWARLLEEGNTFAWSELAANRQALAMMALANCPPLNPPATLKEKILIQARIGVASPQKGISSPGSSPPPPSGSATPSFRNVRREEGQWLPIPVRGLRMKLLSLDTVRNFALLYAELEAGSGFPAHSHSASEEIYVLSGDLRINGVTLYAGDFHHADGDTKHSETLSVSGCTALLLVPANSLPQ